jgi:hypothetical protein
MGAASLIGHDAGLYLGGILLGYLLRDLPSRAAAWTRRTLRPPRVHEPVLPGPQKRCALCKRWLPLRPPLQHWCPVRRRWLVPWPQRSIASIAPCSHGK